MGYAPFNTSCNTNTTDSQDFGTCCEQLTTTTTTRTTTTTTPITTIETTAIAGSMTMTVQLPDGTSASQFIQDDQVKDGYKTGIASSIEGVTKDMVSVTLSVVASGGRRLGDQADIKADYTIKVPASDTQAAADVEQSMRQLDRAIVSQEVNYAVNTAMGLTTATGASIVVNDLAVSGQTSGGSPSPTPPTNNNESSSANWPFYCSGALWVAVAVGMA
jgi:hypothetical protein